MKLFIFHEYKLWSSPFAKAKRAKVNKRGLLIRTLEFRKYGGLVK